MFRACPCLARAIKLVILYMLREFTNKVKVIDGVEGQDFYKIHHIPKLDISITVACCLYHCNM